MVPKIPQIGTSAPSAQALPVHEPGAGPIAGHMIAALVGAFAGFVTFITVDPSGVLDPPSILLSYFAALGRGFAFFFAFNGWVVFLAMFVLLVPVSYVVYRLTNTSRLRTPAAILYGMLAAYGVTLLAYFIAGRNPLNTDACRNFDCMHASAFLYLPAGAIAGLVFARVAYGRWWGVNILEPSAGVRP